MESTPSLLPIPPTRLRRESFEEETAERFQISVKAADHRIGHEWNKMKQRKEALPPRFRKPHVTQEFSIVSKSF